MPQKIMEGKVVIYADKSVFYNPKMSKLRDISVLFLKVLGTKHAKLLDSTAASGIRGIRYAKEAGVKDLTMLDINPNAVKNIRKNAKANKLKPKIIGKSIQEFANTYEGAFDIIDVDPFGTPAPLIHDILKISKDGTVLMVTATDTATLCGAEGNACLRIYGSRPIHNELCHEAGVRILLNYLAREAAQFNFGIEPMLSISDMHYMRVFLRLNRGARLAVESIKNCGFGLYCSNCHNFSCQKGVAALVNTKCGFCGRQVQEFGPVWLGNLKDKSLISEMLGFSEGYSSGMIKLIERIGQELDTPFFYAVPKITAYLKSGSVPLDPLLGSLQKRHEASRTHFEEDAIKTTAGIAEVIKAVKSTAVK